ncbi:MAG: squalene/phytoene synthase family protein [Pseudomonadota bacterium]
MVNDALTRYFGRARGVSAVDPIANPESALVLGYARPALRPALTALFELDATLAAVLRTTREPLVGQMRLTWWHEALSRLDSAPPPAEPVLVALAATVLPHGVTGARLATMLDGWEELLDEDLAYEAMIGFAEHRGAGLFGIAGKLLGAHAADPLAAAGTGWALVDLARHLRDPRAGEKALSAARSPLGAATGVRWSRETRALGALTHLALLDASVPLDQPLPVGSPRRVARLAWHRLSGR